MDADRGLVEALSRRGYALDGDPFPVGRPDRVTVPVVSAAGERLLAKRYPTGGADVYATMQALWDSSFGARRTRPGLPRPVEFLPDAGAVVMERVAGRPMLELGEEGERHVEDAIALLAHLHGCDTRPVRRRSANGVLRSVARKAADARAMAPTVAHRFESLLERLHATKPAGGPLTPGHGDFSARNVLVGPGRLVLIDWDRFCLADPARDVAYIGVWSFAWALRTGRQPCWAVLDRAVAAHGRLRPDDRIGPRIAFYAAAGLARISHSILRLWPADARYVPGLLDEAERLLP